MTIFEMSTAFAEFLVTEVGVVTFDDPAVQLAVGLEARPDISALIDTTPFAHVLGSGATSSFPSYFIAQRGAASPSAAAIDMLKNWCDHALYLDGYEASLSALA